jgi:hypothetical protein
LKAEDYKAGDVVLATGFIQQCEDIETKFGTKTLLTLQDGDRLASVFVNMISNNNLVEAYGENDEVWKGKPVRVICDKDDIFNKKKLVIEALN